MLRSIWGMVPATGLIAVLVLAGGIAQGQTSYRIDAFAGTASIGDGALATQAMLGRPLGVAADSKGGFYIADADHYRIRYVDASGNISTVAGTGVSGSPSVGVRATESAIGLATGLALDSQGQLYFTAGCTVVRINSNGTLAIVAGVSGACGFSGDDGPATQARLNWPQGLALGPSNTLFIGDTFNFRIRKVDLTTGVITTMAGTGGTSFGAEGAQAASSPMAYPYGIQADSSGNLFVAEAGYRRVRRIAADGTIRTVAGYGGSGYFGDGGPAASARFYSTFGLALDSVRNRLYISDPTSNLVRVVDLSTQIISHVGGIRVPAGFVEFVSGLSFGGDGGPAAAAGLATPRGLATDPSGNLLIADERNSRIRQVQTNGNIRTVAGRWPVVKEGAPSTSAELGNISFRTNGRLLASDSTGAVYIADSNMLTVRRVDSSGAITTFAGLPIDQTPANGPYGYSSGDGGSALKGTFGAIDAIAIDATNNSLFVADGTALRRVTAGAISKITTLPGGTSCMRFDSSKNLLYFAVSATHAIYQLDMSGTSPVPLLIAGTSGRSGFSGDGGPAAQALLNGPTDLALDRRGSLLIADSGNNRIRRIGADGQIQTIAGTGAAAASGSIPASAASLTTPLSGPWALAVDSKGNIVTGEFVDIVRMIDATTGQIRLIGGSGVRGSTGDGGLATAAGLYGIFSVAIDPTGAIYVLGYDNRVRVLRPLPPPSAVQLNGGNNQSGTVGVSLAVPLSVKVLAGATPLAGITVDFKVITGAATLSSSSPVSDASGIASTIVTLGANAGTVAITATVSGLPAITFNLTATALVNPNLPAIRTANGVVTAGAFGGAALIAPGGWIEIYGANLASSLRSWTDSDFRGDQAPTSLDGVTVSFDGKPGYVAFISPGQLNVQVPDGVTPGSVRIVVTTAQGASGAYTVAAATRAPALLAPPVFAVNGVQYVAALFADGYFVGRPDLIPGAPFRPAKPGDTIVLYGVGLGPTEPAQPSGQVVRAAANLRDVSVQIGNSAATVSYAGLIAGIVGLYQVNVIVPAIADGDASLTMLVDGIALSQKNLMLTVSN